MKWPIRLASEMQPVPWWMGVAYTREWQMTHVMAPIGLHRLIGYVRQAWRDYRWETCQPHSYDKARLEGFNDGQAYADARHEARFERRLREALDRQVPKEVERMLLLIKVFGKD